MFKHNISEHLYYSVSVITWGNIMVVLFYPIHLQCGSNPVVLRAKSLVEILSGI